MTSKRKVQVGTLTIGGGSPVRVESMLKTRMTDVAGCIDEINALSVAGCEMARAAFPDSALKENLAQILKNTAMPIMADIHFDYKLALAALDAGVPSIRINPGNMGKFGLNEITAAAKDKSAVIRIGANGGSLSNDQLKAANGERGKALAAAVEEQLSMLLDNGFEDIIISAKSSDIEETLTANKILASRCDFPMHIGITEAGCGNSGVVKGAIGIGAMLMLGIGDTIRVSLTAPGINEVETGWNILKSLKIRERGWRLISCPTCGRRRIEVASLVEKLKNILLPTELDGVSIAVMGCEVNGPKEASNADFGIAGAPDGFIAFRKGEFVCRGKMEDFETVIKRELLNK